MKKVLHPASPTDVTDRQSPEISPDPGHAEICEVTGQAVKAMLVYESEEAISIQHLSGVLWRMSISAPELWKKKACLAAIGLLAERLH
ncbi:hypothetical protein [Pantoea sp. ME81]|uniref:hypothetical protein n=1 Tax=Pantoea sp. ME81 TaxID=2743935 RepID=UPI00210316D8|nr:hypothetical protein [Pantoea sp. ME81]